MWLTRNHREYTYDILAEIWKLGLHKVRITRELHTAFWSRALGSRKIFPRQWKHVINHGCMHVQVGMYELYSPPVWHIYFTLLFFCAGNDVVERTKGRFTVGKERLSTELLDDRQIFDICNASVAWGGTPGMKVYGLLQVAYDSVGLTLLHVLTRFAAYTSTDDHRPAVIRRSSTILL